MLRWAFLFLVFAIIAACFGAFGVAHVAANIAWGLFAFFIILFLIALVFGGLRRPPI